jgi:2-ketocyclohexanecarboxyl-CoA hydrolase
MTFDDVVYEKQEGIGTITINRPSTLNALRTETVAELIEAFQDAWRDRSIGVLILTGAGDAAFCTSGDMSVRNPEGYLGARSRYDIGTDAVDLHAVIREIPKPVIAAVNGDAIGSGNVLHVICDLTIAADRARFGQVGPRLGSVDPGFGTVYLARVVGEKKAREIWYLCREYTAEEALAMGLVNKVVPASELMNEARQWAREILEKSPTAIKIAKASFNAETDHIRGIGGLGMTSLALYYGTPEAIEGRNAFADKRTPDFRKFRK